MNYGSITRFARFQFASFVATAVDFGITILLKEVCMMHYLPSTSIGTLSGGIANFLLSRTWVFNVKDNSASWQALRYVFTWTCSISLNIIFVYLLTDVANLNYLFSKIVTAIIIGISFNYSMHRKFVFAKSTISAEFKIKKRLTK